MGKAGVRPSVSALTQQGRNRKHQSRAQVRNLTYLKNYLGSCKEFELDKKTIVDFCKFAVMFFENVEDPKPRT